MGAGLRFLGWGWEFFVGLGIIREAGLTCFREGLTFFSGGVAIFLGGVEILLGGVEIFSEGLRLYPGGVEIFFGRGGLRNIEGVEKCSRCVKFSGRLRNIPGVENYLVALSNFQGGCM